VLNAVVRDTELTISPPLAEQSVQKGQSGNAPRQRMMGKQTMNTVNLVVADVVTKLNESRTEEVQCEAVRLIGVIANEQAKIEASNKRIADLRVEGDKLARNVVTVESALGSPLPVNANTETITKVVEKANKDKQYSVEQSATRITSAIVSEQDSITLIEKRIKELREALLKLTVPTVSVEQIVG